jgi:hypothetical protein
LFPLFATGVVHTGGKFASGVIDTGGKFASGVIDTGGKFASDVIDTGGKFAAGVIDTDGNFPPVSLTWHNLSPVLLIPAVHLDLRISPQISKKIEMTLMLFSGAWAKMIDVENLPQKIS